VTRAACLCSARVCSKYSSVVLCSAMRQEGLDPTGMVHKASFHDPNFIGIFDPDSEGGCWSNGYRI
jgi:hypothetical protein